MTAQKPHFLIIAGRPCEVKEPESKIEQARKRFGGPFAHEPGTRWKPRATRLLTDWMATRVQKERA